MGVVLTPLAEQRLFLSIDAYGASWLWRPGVLLIAGVIVAGLIVPGARGSRARADASETSHAGERVLAGCLILVLIAALFATGGYSSRPATVPRGVAAATILCLLVLVATASRKGAGREARSTEFEGWRTLSVWIPAFLVCIWMLGFVVGAPLALLGYFLITAKERPLFAAAASAATFVFLYAILGQLLGVPFPPGVLLA